MGDAARVVAFAAAGRATFAADFFAGLAAARAVDFLPDLAGAASTRAFFIVFAALLAVVFRPAFVDFEVAFRPPLAADLATDLPPDLSADLLADLFLLEVCFFAILAPLHRWGSARRVYLTDRIMEQNRLRPPSAKI